MAHPLRALRPEEERLDVPKRRSRSHPRGPTAALPLPPLCAFAPSRWRRTLVRAPDQRSCAQLMGGRTKIFPLSRRNAHHRASDPKRGSPGMVKGQCRSDDCPRLSRNDLETAAELPQPLTHARDTDTFRSRFAASEEVIE
jgi:hypothetical protein